MTIVVIDYGMGNLGSTRRSLEVCGAEVVVSENPEDLKTSSGIVLPGVGSFADGMDNLTENGWVDILTEEVIGNKIPFLGICLGMQLLADSGTEGGRDTKGLGFIKGNIQKLKATHEHEAVPHVGWNEVEQKTNHPIFKDIENKKDFYFVHSYHFNVASEDNVIGNTPYCGEFNSMVTSENIIGTQFHPEKSQIPGMQLLKNFIELC